MQKTLSNADMRPVWPWRAEDLRVTRVGLPIITVPWWQRLGWQAIALWLGVMILLAGTGVLIQRSLYQQTLAGTAQWIEQESQRQATCLRAARTDTARRACAVNADRRVAAAQQRFSQDAVAFGEDNAAGQMNDAFNALAAATCVDAIGGTVDTTCLATSAPRLWLIAVMDARAARTG